MSLGSFIQLNKIQQQNEEIKAELEAIKRNTAQQQYSVSTNNQKQDYCVPNQSSYHQEYVNPSINVRKSGHGAVIFCVIFVLIAITVCWSIISNVKNTAEKKQQMVVNNYENELAYKDAIYAEQINQLQAEKAQIQSDYDRISQYFTPAQDYNPDKYVDINAYIEVLDIELTEVDTYPGVPIINFEIKNNGFVNDKTVTLEKAVIVVQKKDNTVETYAIETKNYAWKLYDYSIRKYSIPLFETTFDEIQYIKISDLKLQGATGPLSEESFEIELINNK